MKKPFVFVFFCFFLWCCSDYAIESDWITWMRTYTPGSINHGNKSLQLSDGSYVTVGTGDFSFGSESASQVFLLKVDRYGTHVWSQALGFENSSGHDVIRSSDGGFAICGEQQVELQKNNALFIRTDMNGTPFVTMTHGGFSNDSANAILETDNHDYLLVGQTQYFAGGPRDIYLIRLDQAGTEIWQKTYGGSDEDFGRDIVKLNDGYLIGGSTRSNGSGDFDFYLIKISESGDEIWQRTYGGPNKDRLDSLSYLAGDGFLLLGDTSTSKQRDVLLIKTDLQGNETWRASYGTGWKNDSGDICPVHDGGSVITYSMNSFEYVSYSDICLLRIDAAGRELWTRTIGLTYSRDSGKAVMATDDGGFLVTGSTGPNLLLVKTDDLGHYWSENE